MVNKEHILSEIKRTAEENGGTPLGTSRFEKETGIKKTDWHMKIWCGWQEAVEEAGYTPNTMNTAYESDFLIQKLIELVEELGHFPTTTERRFKAYQDKGFPSHNTFSRFGKKHNLIQAVLDYCNKQNVNDKVVDICKVAATKEKPRQPRSTDSEEIEYEFVYLMKSGKYFKIGRSNCAERREFELKILLPEKLKLIHKIKTDDPVGIENYWHNRFKDKRRSKSEWFDLSASDVKIFKRRNFM